jgi:acetoin utilization deacetylase AcuC-like enzyme
MKQKALPPGGWHPPFPLVKEGFSGTSPQGAKRTLGGRGSLLRVFHSDSHLVPLPAGHRFPMAKYRLLRAALLGGGLLQPDELAPAELAAVETLALVHTPRWLQAVLEGRLSDAEVRRLGFPWSEALVARSRASVGGTCSAAVVALAEGFAANLAGGTHHAFADHGEGFCVFNDVAVSIRALQAAGSVARALVVDLDVHQGNGTAAVFAQDPSVFTFSMHGEHNFPFRKQPSSLDVGLEDGTADAAYLDVLYRHLPRVLDVARPDVIYYQAGVDPLAQDTLGRLALTEEGLEARDHFVFESARRRNLPLVLTLGGGYARPLEATIAAHLGTYRAARAVYGS